jgi:hypothetical protein
VPVFLTTLKALAYVSKTSYRASVSKIKLKELKRQAFFHSNTLKNHHKLYKLILKKVIFMEFSATDEPKKLK